MKLADTSPVLPLLLFAAGVAAECRREDIGGKKGVRRAVTLARTLSTIAGKACQRQHSEVARPAPNLPVAEPCGFWARASLGWAPYLTSRRVRNRRVVLVVAVRQFARERVTTRSTRLRATATTSIDCVYVHGRPARSTIMRGHAQPHCVRVGRLCCVGGRPCRNTAPPVHSSKLPTTLCTLQDVTVHSASYRLTPARDCERKPGVCGTAHRRTHSCVVSRTAHQAPHAGNSSGSATLAGW